MPARGILDGGTFPSEPGDARRESAMEARVCTSRLSLATLAAALLIAIPVARAELAATLPDPDGKPADMAKPVKVFILMG